MEQTTEYITDSDPLPPTPGAWVILELFGHKVISGLMTKDESLGAPLIRIDVPATQRFPEFTRHYHPNAIYSVSYVSEEAARLTADQILENPISCYVPELGDLNRLRDENESMKMQLERLHRALRQPALPSSEDE